MKKAKIKTKIRKKVIRMLNEQQKKISRGVSRRPVPMNKRKDHTEAK